MRFALLLGMSVALASAAHASCPWDTAGGLDVSASMTRVVVDGRGHDVLGPAPRAEFKRLLQACGAPEAVGPFERWRLSRQLTNIALAAGVVTFGVTWVAVPVTAFVAGEERKQMVRALSAVDRPNDPPTAVAQVEPAESARRPAAFGAGTDILETTPAEPAAQAAEPAFRKTSWGMSRADILAVETAERDPVHDDRLIFRDRVAHLPVVVLYELVDDQLVRGKYVSLEEHTNPNDHIRDYDKLRDLLRAKYGPPTEDELVWKTEDPRRQPAKHGEAVSMGELVYFASWDTPETEVVLALLGDNHDVTLAIEYHSKAYAAEAERAREAERLEGL